MESHESTLVPGSSDPAIVGRTWSASIDLSTRGAFPLLSAAWSKESDAAGRPSVDWSTKLAFEWLTIRPSSSSLPSREPIAGPIKRTHPGNRLGEDEDEVEVIPVHVIIACTYEQIDADHDLQEIESAEMKKPKA
ncbi:hypothetical protein B296_00014910 [Ensete ventricosum]|uniref:Uncharacterized protein n=1 Tax=Ensete ventricosum TaxID=4639 RepID=A0A426Y4G6_ENSVE|nr:hypothetical protein B296_00014910 [Ensete ventricosum]